MATTPSSQCRFLLRFDDICPTMNWAVWGEVESILKTYLVKPIVAVVPDNKDGKLVVSQPESRFWDIVRTWQQMGWTIGLHGYQHTYATHSPGLLGYKKDSEFSGLSYAIQREKISLGLDILKRQSIYPTVWVAPSHSFDSTTVRVLKEQGIGTVSDGYALAPFTDMGVTWLPVQHFRLKPRPFGLWTICYHVNSWSTEDLKHFANDIEAHAHLITDVTDVLQRYEQRKRGPSDLFLEGAIHLRTLAYRMIH